MLKQLGAGLAKTALEVPRLIDCTTTARFCSLIETHVPGRPMDSLIRDGRHRDVGAIADRLAEWLSQWNRQTLRHVELTPALAELLILSAARELAGTIDRGSAYVEWLSGKTARLIGHKVPLVAAHNDLTMANVLGDRLGHPLGHRLGSREPRRASAHGLSLCIVRCRHRDWRRKSPGGISRLLCRRGRTPAASAAMRGAAARGRGRTVRMAGALRSRRLASSCRQRTGAFVVTLRPRLHRDCQPACRRRRRSTEPAGSCATAEAVWLFHQEFRRRQAIPAAVRLARAGA